MRDTVHAGDEVLDVPESASSQDGYAFSPAADRWRLNKDTTFSLTFLREVTPQTSLGFRLALTRYAEEFSAYHTAAMRHSNLRRFIRDTATDAVTTAAVAQLAGSARSERDEWQPGGAQGVPGRMVWMGVSGDIGR